MANTGFTVVLLMRRIFSVCSYKQKVLVNKVLCIVLRRTGSEYGRSCGFLQNYWQRCETSKALTSRVHLKCVGTRAETRLRLSAKRTSPFKSAGVSVQSTSGSRGVRISGRNAGYTMFRGSVKSTGYPLHSPVSLSLLLPCVTVCHHISTGLSINTTNAYPQSRGHDTACIGVRSSKNRHLILRTTFSDIMVTIEKF
jgi:hypothetical protein